MSSDLGAFILASPTSLLQSRRRFRARSGATRPALDLPTCCLLRPATKGAPRGPNWHRNLTTSPRLAPEWRPQIRSAALSSPLDDRQIALGPAPRGEPEGGGGEDVVPGLGQAANLLISGQNLSSSGPRPSFGPRFAVNEKEGATFLGGLTTKMADAHC